MAAIMASKQQICLPPTMLGYIYYGLGEATSNPDHPGKDPQPLGNILVGGVISLPIYHHHSDSNCPDDFPSLTLYHRLDVFLWMGDIFLSGLAHIMKTLDLLAGRARASQSLNALLSMIVIYKLKEIFGVVETVAQIEGFMDVNRNKLKLSLDLKRREAKQVKMDVAKAGFFGLLDLENGKGHLKNLITFVISINNEGIQQDPKF
ncbi:hypothetical protein Cgig2_012377 [Carnegiea gigantea]|uniref:Uncharacterized protein n=1 Tax=Carnegiea gigantea TaxID=171969 RepID=A0A9Q1KMB9_9CARY|nr:hypothetical protein Cgig2_012377 [Carnegiea gigantea]